MRVPELEWIDPALAAPAPGRQTPRPRRRRGVFPAPSMIGLSRALIEGGRGDHGCSVRFGTALLPPYGAVGRIQTSPSWGVLVCQTDPNPALMQSPPSPTYRPVTLLTAGSMLMKGLPGIVTHTAPSPAAMQPPLPGASTSMVALTVFVFGSMRVTVPSPD